MLILLITLYHWAQAVGVELAWHYNALLLLKV